MCVCAKSFQLHLTLGTPVDCSQPGSSVRGSPGKNTGVGCLSLLQGISLTRGSNPRLAHLLHGQAGRVPLVPPGKSSCPIQVLIYGWRNTTQSPGYLSSQLCQYSPNASPFSPGMANTGQNHQHLLFLYPCKALITVLSPFSASESSTELSRQTGNQLVLASTAARYSWNYSYMSFLP